MSIELLGTSHISPDSAKKVREAVENYDIIAVELDKTRLEKLFSDKEEKTPFWSLVRQVGLSGAFFAIIGQYVQKKFGGRIGMKPGADMKAAVLAAAKHQKKVALIDQHILITLRRFSKAFTLKEKFRILFKSLRFTKVQINLKEVPTDETVTILLKQLKDISPALYKVLVHERNVYMTKALKRLEEQNPDAKMLAVVGAGHVPGMRKLLKA